MILKHDKPNTVKYYDWFIIMCTVLEIKSNAYPYQPVWLLDMSEPLRGPGYSECMVVSILLDMIVA